MRAIEQRLAKLEQANPAGVPLYALGPRQGETADQAIARRVPGGFPAAARWRAYRVPLGR
jgi:hypothetical protein